MTHDHCENNLGRLKRTVLFIFFVAVFFSSLALSISPSHTDRLAKAMRALAEDEDRDRDSDREKKRRERERNRGRVFKNYLVFMRIAYLLEKGGKSFRTHYDHIHPSISNTSFLLSLSFFLFCQVSLSPSVVYSRWFRLCEALSNWMVFELIDERKEMRLFFHW